MEVNFKCPALKPQKSYNSNLLEKSASCLLTIICWRVEEADQREQLWGYPCKWLSGKCLFNLFSYIAMFLLNERKNEEFGWPSRFSYLVICPPVHEVSYATAPEENTGFLFIKFIQIRSIFYFPSLKKEIAFSMTQWPMSTSEYM